MVEMWPKSAEFRPVLRVNLVNFRVIPPSDPRVEVSLFGENTARLAHGGQSSRITSISAKLAE